MYEKNVFTWQIAKAPGDLVFEAGHIATIMTWPSSNRIQWYAQSIRTFLRSQNLRKIGKESDVKQNKFQGTCIPSQTFHRLQIHDRALSAVRRAIHQPTLSIQSPHLSLTHVSQCPIWKSTILFRPSERVYCRYPYHRDWAPVLWHWVLVFGWRPEKWATSEMRIKAQLKNIGMNLVRR